MPTVPVAPVAEAIADPTGAALFYNLLETYGPSATSLIVLVFVMVKYAPKLVATFREDAEKTRQALREELKDTRQTLRDVLRDSNAQSKEDRDAFLDALATQRAENHKALTAQRDAFLETLKDA